MPDKTASGSATTVASYTRILANDEQALKLLYAQNYSRVERYILENSGSVDDAKDVYQEAFLAAWRNIQLGKFTEQHDNAIHGYLFQIAKNKWLDALRSRKRKNTINMPGTELPEEILVEEAGASEQDEYIEQVKSHYLTMGSPCKEVLGMFYFRKESLRKIAEYFSWTEPTAKNNKYRCLQKLRAQVLEAKE